MVYVLSKEGRSLMPTTRHGRVRHLIEDGRACVVRRTPFTIRLLEENTKYRQSVSPGISSKKLTLLKKRQSLLTGILAIPPAHQDAGFPRQRGKL